MVLVYLYLPILVHDSNRHHYPDYRHSTTDHYLIHVAQMTESITPLPTNNHDDCTGCDYIIKAAINHNKKPPARGRSTWKFDRGNGKIYWLCVSCAARASHVHGVKCAMNPTGAKSITLSIVPAKPGNTSLQSAQGPKE